MGEGRSFDQRKADVRRRLSLSAVIEPHVKLSGTAGTPKRRGQCPFHGSSSASFALFDANKGTGGAFCFGCQWKGDLFAFLMDFHGWDFATALTEAERMAGTVSTGLAAESRGPISRDRNPVQRRSVERVAPIEMGRWIWRQARPDVDAARRYMRGRGVPAAALAEPRMAAFRYLADCPCAPWKEGADPRSEMVAPALIALVRRPMRGEDGSIAWEALGLHVTYLNPAGDGTMVRRKPWAKADDPDPMLPKRRMLGPVGGGAVLLGAYDAGAPLFVGEGNETVLSAMGLANAPAEAIGVATLSLDNLQGAPKLWGQRTWPLFAIMPDPERPCFSIPGHRGPVTGLIDSDMSPLRGMRDRGSGAFLGERTVERKGGPIVLQPITGAERARICGELFVKGWRAAGAVDVSAVRAPAGMDFNDAARGMAHV